MRYLIIALFSTMLTPCLLTNLITNTVSKKMERQGVWINEKYLKCLENELPCECEKKTNSLIVIRISINSQNGVASGWLFSSNDIEYQPFFLKQRSETDFDIYLTKDTTNLYGKFIFNESELEVLLNSSKEKISFKYGANTRVNPSEFHHENVNILNKSFKQRGIPDLQNILKEDSLGCYCKKWNDEGNYIYSKNRSWLIERKKDSIFFYERVDTSMSAPPKIMKNLLIKFKFK